MWSLQLHTVSVPVPLEAFWRYNSTWKRTFKKLNIVANGDAKNSKNLPHQIMVVKSNKPNLPVLLQDAVTKLQESVKSIPPPSLLVNGSTWLYSYHFFLFFLLSYGTWYDVFFFLLFLDIPTISFFMVQFFHVPSGLSIIPIWCSDPVQCIYWLNSPLKAA